MGLKLAVTNTNIPKDIKRNKESKKFILKLRFVKTQ